MKTIRIYSQHVRMEFQIEKGAMLKMKNGKKNNERIRATKSKTN